MSQALRNEDVTVFGDGTQTRSFTYITDLVDGIIRLMLSDVNDPVNIGNPREMTIEEIARDDHQDDRLDEPDRLQAAADRRSEGPPARHHARPHAARWEPKVPLEEGLVKTIEYFRTKIEKHGGGP